MSEGKEEHDAWDAKVNNHPNDKEYGCIWVHNVPVSQWDTHPCNYRLNGYNISLERKGVYNKDHWRIAAKLGYVDRHFEMTSSASGRIEERFNLNAKNSSRATTVKEYVEYAQNSLTWLKRGRDGWHIGVSGQDYQPHQRKKKGEHPNFYPRKSDTQGGYGAFYPYYHEHHHLIPGGAIEEWVIGGDSGDDGERPDNVLKEVLLSKWNINNKENMMMLPREEFVSEIVRLPAHRPWGVPAHPTYQNSVQTKLEDIRAKIDSAMGEKKHPDEPLKVEIKALLDELSTDLLSQVMRMKPGEGLGAVS